MSETTVVDDAPAAPAVNPVLRNMLDAGSIFLGENIERANNLAQKIENQQNAHRLVFQIRDDPEATDPTVKAYQKWIEKVNNQILEQQKKVETHISENLMPSSEDNVDVDAATKEYEELHKTIKAMKTTLETLAPGQTLDIPEIKAIPGVKTRTGNSGQSGIKRPRFSSVDVRVAGTQEYNSVSIPKKNAKGEIVGQTSNLTALSLYVNKEYKANTSAKDFQEAVYAAAKTEDLSTLAGQAIEFGFTVKDKNLEVRVIPSSSE